MQSYSRFVLSSLKYASKSSKIEIFYDIITMSCDMFIISFSTILYPFGKHHARNTIWDDN